MLGLFSLRETRGAATGAPTEPVDRAADPSVLVSCAAPQEAAQLQPPAGSRRASSARANRPTWAFQAGARRSGGADGGAQHGGNSCVCCTRPQPMQQTLDELDFERGLWGACSIGDLARVQELLKLRERDPNERDLSDYTPLHYAARAGHAQVCTLLLNNRAAVDARAGQAAATPLHRACAAAHVEVAQLLLRHNASPTLQVRTLAHPSPHTASARRVAHSLKISPPRVHSHCSSSALA